MFLFDFVFVNIWKFNQTDTDRCCYVNSMSFNLKANSYAYWKTFCIHVGEQNKKSNSVLCCWARLFFFFWLFTCQLKQKKHTKVYKTLSIYNGHLNSDDFAILSFLSSSICRFSPSTYMKIKSILIKYIDKS